MLVAIYASKAFGSSSLLILNFLFKPFFAFFVIYGFEHDLFSNFLTLLIEFQRLHVLGAQCFEYYLVDLIFWSSLCFKRDISIADDIDVGEALVEDLVHLDDVHGVLVALGDCLGECDGLLKA